MDLSILTKLRIMAAMERLQMINHTNYPIASLLEALKKASKNLQNYPFFTTNDPQTAIDTLLELQTQADSILNSDPSLVKLSQLLSNLRSLSRNLQECKGYGLKSLLSRQLTYYRIYHLGFALEREIQNYLDKEFMKRIGKTLQAGDFEEEEKVRVLKDFEEHLMRGFDREFQELILKAKVFSVLESLLCDSTCSKRVREHAALAIVGLVRFNRDVFVGLVLMGPLIQALISMATCCSIQVLCSLVNLIRTPLIDEIELDGEIPRIVSLLSSDDLAIQLAALDCVCQIAFFGRKEVIEAMLEQRLIEKLVKLQRSVNGEDLIDHAENGISEAMMEMEIKEGNHGEDNGPFAGCVARFAIQVEVGEGLSLCEQKELKKEILRRVREASVSEAEAASIVAEVLWGSSL